MVFPTAVVVGGVIEVAKLLLQAYFTSMRVAGKSDAEIEEFYQSEKEAFAQNAPELLRPPPEV